MVATVTAVVFVVQLVALGSPISEPPPVEESQPFTELLQAMQYYFRLCKEFAAGERAVDAQDGLYMVQLKEVWQPSGEERIVTAKAFLKQAGSVRDGGGGAVVEERKREQIL